MADRRTLLVVVGLVLLAAAIYVHHDYLQHKTTWIPGGVYDGDLTVLFFGPSDLPNHLAKHVTHCEIQRNGSDFIVHMKQQDGADTFVVAKFVFVTPTPNNLPELPSH